MTNVITLIPDTSELFSVARDAADKGVKIISNGQRFALATTPPAGWHLVPVAFKTNARSAA